MEMISCLYVLNLMHKCRMIKISYQGSFEINAELAKLVEGILKI